MMLHEIHLPLCLPKVLITMTNKVTKQFYWKLSKNRFNRKNQDGSRLFQQVSYHWKDFHAFSSMTIKARKYHYFRKSTKFFPIFNKNLIFNFSKKYLIKYWEKLSRFINKQKKEILKRDEIFCKNCKQFLITFRVLK